MCVFSSSLFLLLSSFFLLGWWYCDWNSTTIRHTEQLQFDLESYCWSFLFMLLFLHNAFAVVVCRFASVFVYIDGRKTAIKTNFKFMAARIKWIFVRKMIQKQDTHCKCVIACAAVASCCIFFWHKLNEPSIFQRIFYASSAIFLVCFSLFFGE